MKYFTKRHYAAIASGIILTFLFFNLYRDLRSRMIHNFNQQQFILLDKSSASIATFFDDHLHHLQFLAKQPNAIDLNQAGLRMMEELQEEYSGEVLAVTRMDSAGKIRATIPESPSARSANISSQAHVAEFLNLRRPVLSDVFTSVQGYQTVALHVPVFKEGRFDGSLAMLFPYEEVIGRHIQDMVGTEENHYAWLLSANGNELYCQVAEHIGMHLDSTSSRSELSNRMLDGQRGTYIYEGVQGGSRSERRRYAVYTPINLINTTWSLAIAAPENLILGSITRYRRNLVALSVVVLFLATIFIFQTARASAERKSRRFQDVLSDLSQALTHPLSPHDLGREVALAIWKMNRYDAFTLDFLDTQNSNLIGIYNSDTLAGQDRPHEVPSGLTDIRDESVVLGRGDSMLINRKTMDEHPDFVPFGDTDRRSASLVFVPVYWEETQIAILSIQSYTPDRYSQKDVEQLLIFANQLGGALERIKREEELERSLSQKDVLIREVFHRTKNNMQLIISMLNMQNQITQDPKLKLAFGDIKHRIYAMSLAHEMLYRSEDLTKIGLQPYISNLIVNLSRNFDSSPRIVPQIEVPEINLSLDTAMPLGLALNEIISNTYKHAFPGDASGRLIIKAESTDDGHIKLSIQDDGCGMEAVDSSVLQTLGLRLVDILIKDQLLGEMTVTGVDGTGYEIRFKPPED